MNQETVDRLEKEVGTAYKAFKIAEKVYREKELDYCKKSRRFMQADYELALTDGRLKKIPPKVKKEPKPFEMSLNQIKAIADKLGINLTIEQPEQIEVEIIPESEKKEDIDEA